jgi:hypothetical protein
MNGRNLDYGKTKSSSHEGGMMKKELLSMARDLYNLYKVLDDADDLPQWCHYKIARSSNELASVNKYLTSKIMKKVLDQNMSEEDLKSYITISLQ